MEKIGFDKSVVGLVLLIIYSFNHDVTWPYFAISAVLLTQATNTPLSLSGQLGLLVILLLTFKEGVGVTRSALVALAAMITTTSTIPIASIAIIFGIHRVLSLTFIVTNITGIAVATAMLCGQKV